MDATVAEIFLGVISTGGVGYMAFQHWVKISTARQKLKKETVHADLDNTKNFQEEITNKVIQQFLDQFTSYQKQNEMFMKFFFESLDPLLKEVKENSEHSKKVLTQVDLMERSIREVTDALKNMSSTNSGILMLVSGADPMEAVSHIPKAKRDRAVNAVTRRVVEPDPVTKSEEGSSKTKA